MIHYYSSVEPTEVTVSLSLVLCVLSHFSHVQLFVTLWTVANQDLLLMEFSRQEYWSGLPFPSSGDLPDNAGDIRDLGLIPESGRSGGGHGNSFQYACLENPMDRGA